MPKIKYAAAADSSAADTVVSEASCSGTRHGAHSSGARRRRPAQNRQINNTASLIDWMSASSSASCGAMSFRPRGPASRPTPIPKMTGLVDQRVSGNSALVLTCLRTGTRRSAADGSLFATAADRIVSAHQDLELLQHGVAHEIREVIVQRVAVRLQDPAVPALARIENSPIFTARKSRAQPRPTTAPKTGHCPVRLASAAQPLEQRFELADRIGALHRGPDTELAQWTHGERRGAQPQRLLTVPAN